MQPVVVIGFNYSTTLGVVRSLGEAGYSVWLLNTGKSPTSVTSIVVESKYVVRSAYACVQNPDEVTNVLITEFGDRSQKRILIACDDLNVETIAQKAQQLEPYFYFPCINRPEGSFGYFMQKDVQKNLALSAGFKVARGIVVEVKDGHYELPTDIVFPCITKPLMSKDAPKDYIVTFRDKDSLAAWLDGVKESMNLKLLVEQYLDIEEEYTVTGCAMGQDVVVPCVIRKLRTAIAHRGVSAVGVIESIKEYPQLVQNIKAIASALCMKSLFDVEVIKSHGEYYFNEINLRNGAPIYAITRAGVNLPSILAKHLSENNAPTGDVTVQEDHCVTFVSEKAEYDDYCKEKLTVWQYLKDVNRAKISLLKSEHDPKPYKAFRRNVYKRMLRQEWRHFKKVIKSFC